MEAQEISARLNHLRDLKQTATRLTREAKEAKDAMEAYQHTLFQDMRDAGVFSARTDVGSFSLKSTIYPTVQDREAFVAWCHQNGMDDLIQETEVKGRLGELIRQRLDDGEDLPDGAHYYVKEYISVKDGA